MENGLKEIRKNEHGVSLIEALVAAVIVGIGFVAVYSLSTASTNVLLSSIDREKGNMFANTIMEDIITDLANIVECPTTCPYHNMDIKNQPADTSTNDKKKHQKWYNDARKKFGTPTDNDKQLLTITETAANSNVFIISLELVTRDGKSKNIFKRTINSNIAPSS